MPDDYYVSQYSGEEIDALLASAGAGTVRYDAAQTLTDAQKTQARGNIAAAPDGFGFGALPPVISDPDSLNGTVDGIYHFFNLDNPIEGEASGILVHYQGNFREASSSCRQIFYPGGKWAHHLERAFSGTWTEWEYVNPPMQLGVEYRTTERYMGKPVYVRTVDFGDVPNATTKRVGAFPNYLFVDHIVGYTAEIVISGNRFSLPIIDDTPIEQAYCWLTFDGFSIKTTDDYYSNLSATAKFTVKYTKTTD